MAFRWQLPWQLPGCSQRGQMARPQRFSLLNLIVLIVHHLFLLLIVHHQAPLSLPYPSAATSASSPLALTRRLICTRVCSSTPRSPPRTCGATKVYPSGGLGIP